MKKPIALIPFVFALALAVAPATPAQEAKPRVYKNRLTPIRDPKPLLADHPEFIEPVREVARFNGYAVAVHGSLKRDIDLIAVAWTDQAIPADDLARAVRCAIAAILGNCIMLGEIKPKPHGRVACTLVHPGFAGEIDLSIIPPREAEKTEE